MEPYILEIPREAVMPAIALVLMALLFWFEWMFHGIRSAFITMAVVIIASIIIGLVCVYVLDFAIT